MTSTDERREMRSTVAELLDREAGSARIRTAMAGRSGFDAALWQRITGELGLGALLVPERAGGLGLDFADAAVVLTEFGRRLVPGPLPETLVGTAALAGCGTATADELLLRIANGGLALASAVAEPGSDWDIDRIGCRAVESGGRATLSGSKRFVAFGATADVLLVAARDPAEESSGLGLFAVTSSAAAERRSRMTLDATRRLADIDFDATEAVRLTEPGDGTRVVRLLVDLTLVALAVESAAAAAAALDLTVEYLKVRQQFGRPLGSFQALKHRCADLAVLVHGATATADHATEVAATGSAELAVAAPLAKAVCADVLRDVAAETIQLHGGIGFTFEHDAHLYFKRGKANQQFFGSGEQLRRHLERAVFQ
ncbi:acyl-CoA dehydrogenase family protein [Nakamurella lactea]|uniref:acyl-CoA dehydrogenase family protein n=1 Tax=Nakamurella lactea TaxID=459515 RepID=UPI0004246868|nr:acyl-CoA dehydrogenase family protein [Nakamurella lactea]